MTTVAAKGDFAADVLNATYGATGEFFLNRENEAGFLSRLAGPGSNGGKDSAVFTQMVGGYNKRVLKTRTQDGIAPNPVIATLFNPLPNQDDYMLFRATYSGAGVTSYDNQAVYLQKDGVLTRVFRTGGAASAIFAGGVPLKFNELRLGRAAATAPLALTFALRTGVAGITADKDTGLALYNLNGSLPDTSVPREGLAAGATGVTYGQFTGRVSLFSTLASYTTAAAGVPAFNQALFTKARGGNETLFARKGDVPTTPGGMPFTAFLGENTDSVSYTAFRATLGAPATAATNEGIWFGNGVFKLLFRKGVDLAPVLPGLKIAKFINFRSMFGNTMAQVQLSGPGVTAANDQALLIYQTEGAVVDTIQVLLREGEPAPGCNGARIGVISRVETEGYWGQYIVLATLTGAPAGTELALFQGTGRITSPTIGDQVRRRPVLALRKGALYDNQPSKLKSISFSSGQTPSGAANVGLGRVIQEGGGTAIFPNVVLTLDFANGVRQVMKGRL